MYFLIDCGEQMKILATEVLTILHEQNLKISACESFTGGMFSNKLTNIPGSSKVFVGSFISYSETMKKNIVKVSKRVIKKYGVISQECAEEMVLKTQKLLKSHLTISFTGNAGPTSLENKNVGTAYISILFLGRLESFKFEMKTEDRYKFKIGAVNFAFKEILNLIKK
ncbi:CinA family protein [Williamsoniiplasma somnilux]|uniref:CinA family protein n=1 Tax=Williamsoniiplasma somnilux TaxID=215578 RepID=UPI001B7F84B5|nr:CinA family protein [Williamsoniiplasma somnilux]